MYLDAAWHSRDQGGTVYHTTATAHVNITQKQG